MFLTPQNSNVSNIITSQWQNMIQRDNMLAMGDPQPLDLPAMRMGIALPNVRDLTFHAGVIDPPHRPLGLGKACCGNCKEGKKCGGAVPKLNNLEPSNPVGIPKYDASKQLKGGMATISSRNIDDGIEGSINPVLMKGYNKDIALDNVDLSSLKGKGNPRIIGGRKKMSEADRKAFGAKMKALREAKRMK